MLNKYQEKRQNEQKKRKEQALKFKSCIKEKALEIAEARRQEMANERTRLDALFIALLTFSGSIIAVCLSLSVTLRNLYLFIMGSIDCILSSFLICLDSLYPHEWNEYYANFRPTYFDNISMKKEEEIIKDLTQLCDSANEKNAQILTKKKNSLKWALLLIIVSPVPTFVISYAIILFCPK